jgi:peptidyl-dipeptidase Dcp
MSETDPLLAPWTGPQGGLPPFERVRVEALGPALREAIALKRAEIGAIAAQAAPPTFENTLIALEECGAALRRVMTVYNTFRGTMSVGPMRALETELSPVLAALDDEIVQNAALFARIAAVYEHRDDAGLNAEQRRLTSVVYDEFVFQGAALDRESKGRLGAINLRLAELYTAFSQNVLADEEESTLFLAAEDLAGLPESLRDAAARTAAEKGRAGEWAIGNTRSSMDPFLTYSSRRDLRERGWRMWMMRGDHPGAHDNKPLITEILRLRAEKAALLGAASYAHWFTADNMAKTPAAAMALLLGVWPAAVARAREEVAAMQAVVDSDGGGFRIAPWDHRYYAEKVRRAAYDLDQDEVRQYLQLDNIREGMFWAAGHLYGLDFSLLREAPVYHPDVRAYEVRRGGEHLGVWYFDPYARDGKRSGAWMNSYRVQAGLRADAPIVSNNTNFIAGATGSPVLISWRDAVTMFHEFGHALHGLLSNVTYPTLAGTAVARDFVEFPSQINEHWLPTHEVLSRFALHHETGEPIPAELLAKIDRAATFNEGFGTTEYLAAAIYDLRIHLAANAAAIDPAAFERDLMAELGTPSEIVMRHRPPHFTHVFAGDAYSSGYYVYLWADAMTADAFEAFTEAGDPYDETVAARLYDSVLSAGNTIPPEEAFHRFRGRDVDTAALMRDRGFAVSNTV